MPSYCRLRRRDRRRERGGLHAEVSQNGGFSWGFQRMFDLVDVDGYEGGGLGREFSLEETEYVGSLGADFAEGDEFISDVGTHLKELCIIF